MSVDALEGIRRVLELSKGNVDPVYWQTSPYEAQVQILLDMRYHEFLEQDEETYRAGIPKISSRPAHMEGLLTPLVIDPRIPLAEILRRAYVEPYIKFPTGRTRVNPDGFYDLEPAPTTPYIAFFTPGNPDYNRKIMDGKIQFGEHLRPARLKEVVTFALVAPLCIEKRPTSIKISGSVHASSSRLYASLKWDPDSTVYRLGIGSGSMGLAACYNDSEL